MRGRAGLIVCALIVAAIGAYAPEVIYFALAALGLCVVLLAGWVVWELRRAAKARVR